MGRDHQHNPDPNLNAARIVGQSTSDTTATPADVEAAWAACEPATFRTSMSGV